MFVGRIAIRPYDMHDAVKMIRHHHEFAAINLQSKLR